MLIFIKQKIVKGIWSDKGPTVSGVNRVQSEDSGKLPCDVCRKAVGKSNVDFRSRRCLEEGPVESVSQREVEIEPNVKLECVPKFCYLSDTLGAGGGVKKAARARVRCAWTKFKELSLILTNCGTSYHIKGKIYSACVQSVLTYGLKHGR